MKTGWSCNRLYISTQLQIHEKNGNLEGTMPVSYFIKSCQELHASFNFWQKNETIYKKYDSFNRSQYFLH